MKELNDLAELIKQGEVEKSLAIVKTIIDEGAIEKILSVTTIAMRGLKRANGTHISCRLFLSVS